MDGILKDGLSESAPDDVALEPGLGRRMVNDTLGAVVVDIVKSQSICGASFPNSDSIPSPNNEYTGEVPAST
jgi:hypothetical protein